MSSESSAFNVSRPTMHDVAARAGVALGTVSNVLNRPDKVAEGTRERVQRAIEELGFSRNNVARSLVSGVTRSIGLVVIDLGNSLFVDIARGAQRAGRRLGYSLQLADSDNAVEQQLEHIQFFDEARVAGVLLAPMQDPRSSIDLIRRHGRPVVVLNYASDDASFCSVVVNNDQVGYLAARHMIELGNTRLAFVGGRKYLQPVQQRLNGVRRAVAESDGLVTLVEIDTPDLNPPSGADVGRDLLRLAPGRRPDGIIAVTDLLGVAIIDEIARAGVRVPEEIAVMGCDHNTTAWGGVLPMTSVTLQGQEMGAAAVELLEAELHARDDHHHRTITVEPTLMVRESTSGRSLELSRRSSAPVIEA